MTGPAADACSSCGRNYPRFLPIFWGGGMRLDCRECCTETRRLIHWAQGLTAITIMALVLVLGIPLPDGYRIPLGILVVLLGRLGYMMVRINVKWPGIRARSKIIPAFEIPDDPPPHTPVAPPTPPDADKGED